MIIVMDGLYDWLFMLIAISLLFYAPLTCKYIITSFLCVVLYACVADAQVETEEL